jgi:hypothetical protein
MNKADETWWARWKRRARYFRRRYPLAIFPFLAVFFYLVDCFNAHWSHPEVPWIESGVYAQGPFGFVATVGIVVVGVVCCLKKG